MTIHFVTYRPNIDREFPDDLDRYEDFISWAGEEELEGWSANKSFTPGDLAIFYMTRPLASLVGAGVVDSEPYYEEVHDRADFGNPVFCDFRPMWFLDNPVPIKEAIDRQKLQSWWKTTPYQSIRRMPEDVAEALIDEMIRMNSPAPKWLKRWEPAKAQPTTKITGRTKTIPKPPKPHGTWKLNELRKMNWREFEKVIARLFAVLHRDAEVELTPRSKDKGVDVLLRYPKTGNTEIVQCKRYKARVMVSSPDMQKFAGAMMKAQATKGYFVTTSDFNKFAKDFAEGLPIKLINGRKLVKILNGHLA